MVDFHSHILPNIDDGSDSLETTMKLLEMEVAQGVTTLIATPHFYGDLDAPTQFLARRQDAWEAVLPRLTAEHPKVLLGAEVAYWSGLSKWDCLEDLCISGTNLLLLELPFTPWPQSCYEEITALARQRIQPMIAHIERYFPLQKEKYMVSQLQDCGAYLQCNGSFFLQGFKSRKAFSLFAKGAIDALGSDCHNLTTRQPNLGEAITKLEQKFGKQKVDSFHQWNHSILEMGGNR